MEKFQNKNEFNQIITQKNESGNTSLDLSAIFSPTLKTYSQQALSNDKYFSYYQKSANLKHIRKKRIKSTQKRTDYVSKEQATLRTQRNRHTLHIHKNMIRVTVESALSNEGDSPVSQRHLVVLLRHYLNNLLSNLATQASH